MTALTSVSITNLGGTPAPVNVTATDTIAATQFGSNGCILRVINQGGTVDNVTISDPSLTDLGNVGTPAVVAVPITTGIRMIFIPTLAINQSTQVATVNHTFITTVTCELYRI